MAAQVNTGTDDGVLDPDTFTFGFTGTAGNLLIIDAFTHAIGFATPSGWTLDASEFNSTENDLQVRFSKISDGTESSITVDLSTAVGWTGIVREWSGITQTVDDSTTVARTTSVSALLSGTVTTTVDDTLIIAAVSKRAVTTAESWNSSFINALEHDRAASPISIASATRLVAATGSFSTTHSWTTATTVMGIIVAYKGVVDVEFAFGGRFK